MRLAILATAILISGCANMAATPLQATPEAVYAVIAGKEGLRVRVSSNGCTTKAHFEIVRLQRQVLLRRVTPDDCRSFAMGSQWLDFSYAELGVGEHGEFSLANPLTRWTGPGE